jgi:hypothetical protein
LEALLPFARQERYARISKARDAVMMEQKASGQIQSEWIYTVYMDLTLESDERAIINAYYDEVVVDGALGTSKSEYALQA